MTHDGLQCKIGILYSSLFLDTSRLSLVDIINNYMYDERVYVVNQIHNPNKNIYLNYLLTYTIRQDRDDKTGT